ncbi:MAG: 5'/3'-nucleotidase SurE, partial [Actinomycetia bacterium]|nr:5'/3'-nucleotidase SurE [Actinomycetes bacterium]
GIRALADFLKKKHNVTIVAPDRGKSAIGHSLTLSSPVFVTEIEEDIFAVSGTPADCVVLGLFKYASDADIVISGINQGPNMGEDVFYSGTVAAAREAAMKGRRAFSVSLHDYSDLFNNKFHKTNIYEVYYRAAERVYPLIEKLSKIDKSELKENRVFFNINIPNSEEYKGYRMTRQGSRIYKNHIKELKDPFKRSYFWLTGSKPSWKPDPESDCDRVSSDYISVTPVSLNYTDTETIDMLNEKPGSELFGIEK